MPLFCRGAARYPFLPFPGSSFFPRPSAAYLLTGNSANIRETLNGLFGDRHGGPLISAVDRRSRERESDPVPSPRGETDALFFPGTREE